MNNRIRYLQQEAQRGESTAQGLLHQYIYACRVNDKFARSTAYNRLHRVLIELQTNYQASFDARELVARGEVA